jgi:ABC-2 type transport system permease protein
VAERALASPTTAGLARTLHLARGRTIVEIKQFFRIPEQMFFTFLMPVMLLLIFGEVFSGDIEAGPGRSVPFVQYFLPGMIAMGVMSSTFANLAMWISVEQHDGLLKRLAGTPLPRSSYFIGKLGMAVVVTAIQTALMLVAGAVLFGVDLPAGIDRWGLFLLFLAISAAVGASLGIAYTRLIRNASGGAAIVQPPFLVLQFISGVFFRYQDIPGWLKAIASVFPLKWMAIGMRYSFLPDWFGTAEYGSDWGWERPLAVLCAWLVAGFALALLFFRWSRAIEQ